MIGQQSKGSELWERARTLIPGGNQLLSKRAEMFLPRGWPSYYQKAKGVEVWDIDGKRYVDMSIMGIGTCVLGYAHDGVVRAVCRAVENGNMASLNNYEEVQLAQKLIELHPWAKMARFARTGGEADAIAVRIARTAAKKDTVAFCGYHGWHDWYLSSNLADEGNLDGHLLPGLEPAGVPRHLKGTARPFHYGNIDELKEIVRQNGQDLGVIIMEVVKYKPVDVEFLKQVRLIADAVGAVLIFDEISSGFRLRTGGAQMLYGVNPDILVLGKAMGSGHPIAAVIGTEKVMQAAQQSFISSTYWSERAGYAAALATIDVFEKEPVVEHLENVGHYLRKGLDAIFVRHGLEISTIGSVPVPIMLIKEKDPLVVKTVFTQEMLKKGYLASNIIYLSWAHTMEVIDAYLEAADDVFAGISAAISERRLERMLEGPVCHGGFKRLN